MSENGKLMKRSQVMELLGVSRWGMEKLLESGTLKAIPEIYPGARALYRRSEVEKLSGKTEEGRMKPETEEAKR